ncbi:hypothetical protein FA13DRAFT_856259 [Coprinellus micaceus]|uniref:DUF1996 domain-containing protein n=1 Tax=Coprinellus micaceus TaxID=71717 RepID=A0A4Y7T0S9_COPMI|nr:hypothetical protein FA13DRAFT_856259 [Coprinellus micaceus]
MLPSKLSLLAVGLALLAAPGTVYGLIRFPCSQLVTERFDPLVTPGEVSPHVHQIVGGNAFNLTMDPAAGDISKLATCTTCRFKEDKSNYWTAVLYFKHPNGSYIRVPQMANHGTGPGIQAGGMTVYYFQPRAPTKNLDIVPFAPGFRMIVGNPMRRVDDIDPDTTEAHALTFRCFQGTDPGPFGSPGKGPEDSFHLPSKICTGGIRTNIFYPQCWDGVNLDPPDHASHVAHPAGTPSTDGLQFFGTDCPDTHPVRLPLLFVEIVWDTRPFNDPELWPKDGTQPFIFSMGDPTGFGQHADYVFGWEDDSLQRAMDVCTGADGLPQNCPVLTLQDIETMNNCRLPAKVPEVVEGQYLDRLPGCNPLQSGPEWATVVPNCDAPATTVDTPFPTAPPQAVTPPWTINV